MAMLAVVTRQFPIWSAVAGCAWVAYSLLNALRIEKIEDRKRRKRGKLHTKRDTALLLLTGLSVVGVLLCTMFFMPSNSVVNSEAGFAVIIIIVGGGLTYLCGHSERVKENLHSIVQVTLV